MADPLIAQALAKFDWDDIDDLIPFDSNHRDAGTTPAGDFVPLTQAQLNTALAPIEVGQGLQILWRRVGQQRWRAARCYVVEKRVNEIDVNVLQCTPDPNITPSLTMKYKVPSVAFSYRELKIYKIRDQPADAQPADDQPTMMQILTSTFSAIPREVAHEDSYTRTVHIDNIRFLSKSAQTLHAIRRFLRDRARELDITTNEDLNDETLIRSADDFHGFSFDYAAGTYTLSEKARTKLAEAQRTITQVAPTLQEFLSVAGLLIYLSRAMRHGLHHHFHELKFLRAICKNFSLHQCSLSAPVTIWPSIIPKWSSWINTILNLPPLATCPPPNPHEAFLFTDASLSGWGAVLIISTGSQQHVRVYGEHWTFPTRPQDISMLETIAVEKSIDLWSHLLDHTAIFLLIDNIAAKSAISRRYSPSFSLNTAVSRISSKLFRHHASIQKVSYVKSADNPADVPSRSPMHISFNRQLHHQRG